MRRTRRDERFLERLGQRLGGRLHVVVGEVERDYGRAGVARPGGEGKASLYVVHHLGARVRPGSWDWRRVWDYHTRALGWDTGGYHAAVDHDAHLWLMVPPSRMTYGAGPKWNPVTVHCVALADYADHEPSSELLETIWTWLGTCDDVLGYHPWRPHGAIRRTACPGRRLTRHVRAMPSGARASPGRCATEIEPRR